MMVEELHVDFLELDVPVSSRMRLEGSFVELLAFCFDRAHIAVELLLIGQKACCELLESVFVGLLVFSFFAAVRIL
jgi:hypothetical protein